MELRRSERHLGICLRPESFKATAKSWIAEAGHVADDKSEVSDQAITTHIVVSFPAGTHVQTAFKVGRSWAEEMFGSGRNGGTFDYVTACHSDRPHPHMHLVVNRRALEGHWLKIAHRHAQLNYERLRLKLVEIAKAQGIGLQSSSRLTRGLNEKPATYSEYRRQQMARRTEVSLH